MTVDATRVSSEATPRSVSQAVTSTAVAGGATARWSLAVGLMAYAAPGAILAAANRYVLSPDTVSYLQLGRYWSEGRLADAVSGYWSPLIAWLLVPSFWLEIDPLVGMRIIMFLGAGGLVAAGCLLARRFAPANGPAVLLICGVLGVAGASLNIGPGVPDVLLAVALVSYLLFALDADILLHRRNQVWAGVLGGIAYLAKSYGLPFFLAHFTLCLAAHAWFKGTSAARKSAFKAWAVGVLAFVMVALPWIVTLSVKHGQPTFSTVARIAHTVVGPPDKPRDHPLGGLRVMPEGRLAAWETPEMLRYNPWSPLESRDYLAHQLRVIKGNIIGIIRIFHGLDTIGLFPGAFLLLPMLAVVSVDREGLWRATMLTGTVLLFAAGFLPIYCELRYLNPFAFTLCWILIAGSVFRWLPMSARASGGASIIAIPRWMALVVALVLMGVFLQPRFSGTVNPVIPRASWHDSVKRAADELRRNGCDGPLAVSPEFWFGGYSSAYLLQVPFLGWPTNSTRAGIESELERAGATTFLVSPKDAGILGEFASGSRWVPSGIMKLTDGDVLVFRSPATAAVANDHSK